MARRTGVILLLLLWLGVVGQAHADDDWYAAGRRAYDLRDFDRAIAAWKQGFDKTGDAAYLYNIGSAYREQRDYERAIFYYQRFLVEAGDSPKREAIQKRIEEMKGALTAPPKEPQAPGEKERPPVVPTPAEAARAAEPPPARVETPPPPDPHPGRTLRIAGLATAGGGVALLAVGALFLHAAGSAQDELDTARAQHAPWSADLADAQSSGRRDQLVAEIALCAGGAAVLTGAALTYLGVKKGRVSVEPRVMGMALKVGF